MILAQVEGSVVATKKNPKMTGSKFLVVRPLVVDTPAAEAFRPGSSTLVAVDAVVVGIVDTVDLAKRKIYSAQ